ncbi:MAG: ferredoxin [Candidatus Bathyarchaeota archaeon]|jgi:ferredoxin
MAKFKVEISKDACQGFGACVELCSQFFQLSDKDGKSSFLSKRLGQAEREATVEDLEPDDLACIQKAVEACPFNAIHVMNLETGEKLV